MKYQTTTLEKWKHLKPLARKNRSEMTFTEQIVWNMLRKKQLGVRFRRQQAIADFIVDFVSIDLKLVIEIDGDSHDDKKEYDEHRSKVLNELGFKVIRFTNTDVTENGNLVEIRIKSEILKLKENETEKGCGE
jgi:very-short-patch-repair endonuclease